MKTTPQDLDGAGATARPLTFKVVGVGGTGLGALESLREGADADLPSLAAHTDERRLSQAIAAEKLLLGARELRGLGAGGDPECGRAAAEQEAEALRAFCAGADMVFVVAGLGRGTGTGASPVIARTAKQSGALVLGIVTLPFEFEGPRRQRQAQSGLRALRAEADAVLCLPNQKIFQLTGERIGAQATFQTLNQFLAELVRSFHRLLTRPGLMRVSLADLCAALGDRHTEGVFASIEARGEMRVRDITEQLKVHPLLDGGQAFAQAASVVISIVGGADLTTHEVHQVMETIHPLCGDAQLVVGVATEPDFGDRLALTAIVSRHPPAKPNGTHKAAAAGEDATATAEDVDSSTDFDTEFFRATPAPRPAPRFVPPAPELPETKKQELLAKQRGRKRTGPRMKQTLLPLEIVHKGRFAKSEPTIHNGEDLDVPTYIRRGVVLN